MNINKPNLLIKFTDTTIKIYRTKLLSIGKCVKKEILLFLDDL